MSFSPTAGPAAPRSGLPASARNRDLFRGMVASGTERLAPAVFILPAVLIVLAMSIFPLIVSLYLSLSRFKLAKGGFTVDFIGTLNYQKLLFGSQQFHLLGKLAPLSAMAWLLVGLVAAAAFWPVAAVVRRGAPIGAVIGRLIAAIALVALALLFGSTGSAGGQLGSLGVTLIYVFGGVAIQYLIGLGLAFLCAQKLAGRRFFRVVFFIPMMITPVGVAYTFRMMTDTTKGPLAPLWQWFGLADFAWAATAWGARIAVMIGDAWQWIPFMFIVLLAALEAQPQDEVEAAMVDGANRWQVFRYITLPAIFPVSVTLVLIRVIEAFKIVYLPNVLTNGGPGIASESLTLHAFMAWRALDLGGSAAIAYLLLFVVTFFCVSFASLTRRRGATA
ncbi:MAG TPA: sugar ABC transporter permease [Geminicoccaceae bacterium]|nr:sugar ABC transporter permease [Geminicoccaceae bacterium]